jgi:hypothetical protein
VCTCLDVMSVICLSEQMFVFLYVGLDMFLSVSLDVSASPSVRTFVVIPFISFYIIVRQ